ncbi:MAG TPA: phytase, partial [Opitutaceae bacterium]
MMRISLQVLIVAAGLACSGCGVAIPPAPTGVPVATIKPRLVTEPVRFDTDDPAIWIDRGDPAKSLVVGTDKETDGALYVFDLKGKIIADKTVRGLARPNNVDIAYGLKLGGKAVDIAVVTEREKQRLRVFALPSMESVDKGDLAIFPGDVTRAPMGVALYTRPSDGAVFAIVGGKSGPAQGYLGQYRLEDDGAGKVKMTLVRQFGAYSAKKEIESIAVDNELGYVYYSDEGVGV